MSNTQKVPQRNEIPVEHTWDLTLMYADDTAWENALTDLDSQLPELTALEGKIGESAENLLKTLTLRDNISIQLYQVYRYASQRQDSDSTDPAGQALAERAGSFVARISAATSFIEPEILAIPTETINAWIESEEGLKVYANALEELARQREHVRSAEIEAILAQFYDVTRATGEIFEILTSADIDFPTMEDEAGQTLKLSHARYGRYLESPDRRVRHDAFKGMFEAFGKIRNTLGTTLAGEIRGHVVGARVRNYKSALEAALKPKDIPTEVYHNLIDTVNKNLPRLHRYLKLRKKLMNLDELHFYDLYAPLVDKVDVDVPYQEATQLVSEALKPLGEDYGNALHQAFTNRWIDVYENVGKRSGAYSSGSHKSAPFILLNYQDRLRDVFTLAHELGHSIHSYYSWKTQPFVYSNYTLFVAEVASTLNESLLINHLLKTRSEPEIQKQLIVQQLEDIRATIIRQTMFAEFELYIHEQAEAGEPLTADSMCKAYYELVSRYFGDEVVLDEEIAWEWARIPHFYYNFYVYQYATGLSAALALSKQILSEGQPAVDRYLRFLNSGSSKSSIELLREAGVDMASPEPIQQAMDHFDALLNQLEALEA
jgi:oligoendopeptidase F